MLWSQGRAPGLKTEHVGMEVLKSDMDNPVAKRCCPGDESNFYFNVSEPSMTPFLVPYNPMAAAVMVIPGGGYDFLAWEKEGVDIAVWLNSLNISAFVLKYRVPVGKPTPQTNPTMDAQRAMSMVRYNAAKHNVNPKNIGVIGFSAGGDVAISLAASKREYTKIDAIDNVDFRPNFMLIVYGAGFNYMLFPKLHPKPPPTFLSVAADDPCVNAPVVQMTANSLKAAGGKVDLHVFPDGKHGYGRCSMYTYNGRLNSACDWVDRAVEFLNKYGSPKRVLSIGSFFGNPTFH